MRNNLPRILIVDDDVGHRQSLRIILEEEGFECWEAENGEVAIGLLESKPHDLVLTDLDMPIMDGFQLVKQIHQGVEALKVPTIVVTGNLNKDLQARLLEAGAAQIFTKPDTLEELLMAIRSCLPNNSPVPS